jgi:hypothetical protein
MTIGLSGLGAQGRIESQNDSVIADFVPDEHRGTADVTNPL